MMIPSLEFTSFKNSPVGDTKTDAPLYSKSSPTPILRSVKLYEHCSSQH